MTPAGGDIPSLLGEVEALSRQVAEGIPPLASGKATARQGVEQAVLRGLTRSAEAAQEIAARIEALRGSRRGSEGLDEALDDVERKRAFFQACTMRRSSALAGQEREAGQHAEESERLAASMRGVRAVDVLVEAYKATEAIEARIVALRGAARAGDAPEPRVLDLPRARVLIARRAIGAAIIALDDDED